MGVVLIKVHVDLGERLGSEAWVSEDMGKSEDHLVSAKGTGGSSSGLYRSVSSHLRELTSATRALYSAGVGFGRRKPSDP